MCICKGCGRAIQSEFLYCPWCGNSRVSKESEESLEVLFNRYELMQKISRKKQLQEMEMQLDELEEELSVYVLSAEMAK